MVESEDHRRDRERREHQTEHEDPCRHSRLRHAGDHRALIVMRAVGSEDVLPVGRAADERDGRIGHGVQREQQCRGEVGSRHEDQHEGKQEPDRQAAGVAEKHLRRVLVEDGKAEYGAEQRQRQESDARRHRVQACERRYAQRHRHHLHHGDPIDAVEKIDGVDEPDGAEHEQRPLEQQGNETGEQPQVLRKARHHDEHGKRLADEAPRYRQRPGIVGEPEHRQA